MTKAVCIAFGVLLSGSTIVRGDSAPEVPIADGPIQARIYLPDANGELLSTAVCMYTNTPDEHFILDHHPKYPQVVVASPCSGHGFKFSPVVGELIAGMIQGKAPRFNLELFKIARLCD